MNKKISIGAALAFAVIVATATFSITMVYSRRNFNDRVFNLSKREAMYSKISEIDSLIRQNFNGAIDEDLLMDSVAKGYVGGLQDKYSQYFDAATYSAMMQDYDGKTVGIGIVPTQDESGYIKVSEVYSDSPAYAAGIVAGDLIVKIDETDITAENYQEAVERIKGEAGTKMALTVRKGVEESVIDITRRYVEIPSVITQVEEGIAFVKIKEFNNNTPDQFNKQLDKLLSEDAKAIVFDVRNNPGGPIKSVSEVLDRLLPEGTIATIVDKNGKVIETKTSDARQVALPMVVLTNESTASSAELFAQAIKDYNMGKTVGVRTKGKGTIQTIHPLTDGSALELTSAKYNPPVSPNFDGEGVKPDFEVKLTEEQSKMLDQLDHTTDPQMKKAIEVANAAIKQKQTEAQNAQSTAQSAGENKE